MKRCNSFCKAALLVCAAFWQLSSVSALDYYWVGGSGLWSDHNNHWATTSGGAVFHDQVPQSMDNVFFDANSFPAGGTVTIDQTIIYCMDMDWTGAGNMPVFFGPSDEQVWIYGSLRLVSDMQWEVYGEVHFRAFQIGKTITSAGKEFLHSAIFDGSGGGWTLLDAFHVNLYLLHREGALYTNGQDVTVRYYFSSNGPPSRTLHFGSSNIYIGQNSGNCPYFYMYPEPFNFDAGTSTIYMNSPSYCSSSFIGGNKTYYNLVGEAPIQVEHDNNFHSATFIKSARINGNNHYDILTFTTGQLYELSGGSTQTINPGGAFNGNGSCMDFVTIVSMQAGNAAQIEKTAGIVALSYVVLQDIHAIGGATFSAANSADLGNNVGWAFLPVTSRNVYWVGGGGDWNDANHWSLSSGGAGGECIPTPFDNVFFDQNAGFALPGEQVNLNVPVAFCQNMDWTGVLNSPDLTGIPQNKLFIFGSLKFVLDMAFTFNGEVHFMAHTTGKTITSAGKEFLHSAIFDGSGGGWTLLDAFHVNLYLLHREGALYTNGQDVTVRYYFSSNGPPSRTLHFGSSNIYIGQNSGNCPYFYMYPEPFNFDAGTSTIYMNSPSYCSSSFIGGNKTYYNLVGEAPIQVEHDNNFHSATFIKSARINGNNHYDILTFTTGQLYELSGGSTQTINPGGAFNGNGSCMDFVTIVSMQAGNAAQIEKTAGIVALSYVVLQDIHAIGGATFSAANSADLGNNVGWAFLPVTSRNVYWVGGGGDWNDANHWSLSSGGAGGECIPTPFDNVFFDQNAGFALPGEQVNLNVPVAFCQNMDWTGVLNSPDLTGISQNKLFIFGSLKFVLDMAFTFNGEVHFMAHTTGKTITSAGKEFLHSAIFDGSGGGWTLLDAFHVNLYLLHREGALYTNGQDVTVRYYFSSNGPPSRTLHFGSSNIYIGQNSGNCPYFYMYPEPFNFDAGTSTIYMNSPSYCSSSFIGGNKTYYNLVGEAPIQVEHDNNFHSATFIKSARINGNNIFESLAFSPGSTYELTATSTQTITPLGNFIAEGTGGFPIEIKSSQIGTQAILHKDGDPICLDFLYLTDIAATGSSFTYAGANSDDVFNNSGWIFEACPDCFTAPPLPAPVLDPASVTIVQPGQQATLILQNLPAGYEAVWFDANQATELHASTANLFEPLVNGSTTFYAAFRELATGCVSEVLEVNVCAATLEIVSQTNPSCADNDGQININFIGATAPYSFSWTTVDGGGLNPNAEDQTMLGGGTYQVVAMDVNGCTASAMTFLMAADDNNDLPPGWSNNDVGNANGTAILSPCTGTFVLTATGFSTSSSDVLHTAYQQICGNTQVTARVLTLSGGGWGGVTIRETLEQGSKKVALKTQLTANIRRMIRTTTNGAANNLNFFRPQHTWLRLIRTGSTFVAYTSPNGTNWSFAFSATINMAGCVYVGIFAESINNNTTTTARFDNVSVTGTPLPMLSVANQPPVAENGDHVQIYPNPTTGELNINFDIHAGKSGTIQVFNTLGELVTQERLIAGSLETHRLRIAGSAGVYTVAIQLDDRRIVRRVVVDGND